MANVSISEIQTTAESLSSDDLILVSKKDGTSGYTSAKCLFESLRKSILPCSDCVKYSFLVTNPKTQSDDSTIPSGYSAYDFTIGENHAGNNYDGHSGFVSYDIGNLLYNGDSLGTTLSGNDSRLVIAILSYTYSGSGVISSNKSYNTIDWESVSTSSSGFCFGLGTFAKQTTIRLMIPNSRIGENTTVKIEITDHRH